MDCVTTTTHSLYSWLHSPSTHTTHRVTHWHCVSFPVLVTVGEEAILSVEDILVQTAGKVEHCGATLGVTTRGGTREQTEHTE